MVMFEFKSMTIKGIKQNGFSTGYRCKLCKRSVNVHWLVQLAHWLQSAWLFLIGSSSETPVKTKDGIGVSSDNQMRKKRDWRRLVWRQWYATGLQWFDAGKRSEESREIRRRKRRGWKILWKNSLCRSSKRLCVFVELLADSSCSCFSASWL